MLQGLVPVESGALEQWRRVDFVAEFNPEVRSAMDRNGVIVVVSSINPYFFEMPDKIGDTLPPPPHCGKCSRPISRIRVVCTPEGASIEASCHGSNAGKFLFIESLTAQGPDAIYLQILEAFSNKGGFQKSDERNKKKSSFLDDTLGRPWFEAPNCCLCEKAVSRVKIVQNLQRGGTDVIFDCHGRRQIVFIPDEKIKLSRLTLEELIQKERPFLDDYRRLNATVEPTKPKTRTGLTITIGQERVISLE